MRREFLTVLLVVTALFPGRCPGDVPASVYKTPEELRNAAEPLLQPAPPRPSGFSPEVEVDPDWQRLPFVAYLGADDVALQAAAAELLAQFFITDRSLRASALVPYLDARYPLGVRVVAAAYVTRQHVERRGVPTPWADAAVRDQVGAVVAEATSRSVPCPQFRVLALALAGCAEALPHVDQASLPRTVARVFGVLGTVTPVQRFQLLQLLGRFSRDVADPVHAEWRRAELDFAARRAAGLFFEGQLRQDSPYVTVAELRTAAAPFLCRFQGEGERPDDPDGPRQFIVPYLGSSDSELQHCAVEILAEFYRNARDVHSAQFTNFLDRKYPLEVRMIALTYRLRASPLEAAAERSVASEIIGAALRQPEPPVGLDVLLTSLPKASFLLAWRDREVTARILFRQFRASRASVSHDWSGLLGVLPASVVCREFLSWYAVETDEAARRDGVRRILSMCVSPRVEGRGDLRPALEAIIQNGVPEEQTEARGRLGTLEAEQPRRATPRQ